MATRQSWMRTGTAGAAALGWAVLASAALASAAVAQAASNPADVLAPAERETFTFTFRSTVQPELNVWRLNEPSSFELPAGGKWRFTLNLDNPNDDSLNLDSLRAGAFFDVTPRMRLGGALSFSDEDRAITRASGGQLDGDVPEVKFESAFKF